MEASSHAVKLDLDDLDDDDDDDNLFDQIE